MSSENKKDCLDGLLYAAAKNAGKKDITEYNLGSNGESLPCSLSEKIAEIPESTSGYQKKKGKFGFRRFAAIAAAAALLVCGLTMMGTAGKKQHSASAVISDVAGKYVLTYDLDGIKADKNADADDSDFHGFTKIGRDGDSHILQKDGITYSYGYTPLNSSYSAVMGTEENVLCFDIVINSKYKGCVAEARNADSESTVYWNNGKYAFELSASCDTDTLCRAAQLLCE